jgi:hypothetical protein
MLVGHHGLKKILYRHEHRHHLLKNRHYVVSTIERFYDTFYAHAIRDKRRRKNDVCTYVFEAFADQRGNVILAYLSTSHSLYTTIYALDPNARPYAGYNAGHHDGHDARCETRQDARQDMRHDTGRYQAYKR